MRFLSSKSIESKIAESDLEESRENLVKQGITTTKEWKDHVKDCDVGELKRVTIDKESFEFQQRQQETTERPIRTIEKREELKVVSTDEQVKIHQTEHQQPQQIGNEIYFGVVGGRKVLAGCGCGEDVQVTANLQTQYLPTDTKEQGKSLYGAKEESSIAEPKQTTYGNEGFSWEQDKKKKSIYHP